MSCHGGSAALLYTMAIYSKRQCILCQRSSLHLEILNFDCMMLIVVVFLHTFVFLFSLQAMNGLYIILLLTYCVMTQQCLTSEGSLTRSTQYSGASFHHLQRP